MTPVEVRHVVAWQAPIQRAMCATLWLAFALSLWPALQWPLRELALIGFAAALSRTLVVFADRRAQAPQWLAGLAIAIDVGLLTGLLDITGGPFNPFVVMYAAYVWLAAATLNRGWGVATAAMSVATFGWLVVDHLQAGLAEHHRLNDFPTHLFTMWFAAATIAQLVAHYVGRAGAALAQRQHELDMARERAARSDHLASLTTLAAGAAHELSTPLSTIAVAARELERTAQGTGAVSSGDLQEDVRLIKDAVQRCRSILDGMSGRATGDVSAVRPIGAAEVAELAASSLPESRRHRLDVEVGQSDAAVDAPIEVARALSSLLKNAFDASGDERVCLHVSESSGRLRFEVIDSGHGMSEDIRRRAGEPFFTTKPPGEGLGLGLFLARTVAETSGGSLRFEGTSGTTVILELPIAVHARA
jgi:two-component system sensor histidine kinase RegB